MTNPSITAEAESYIKSFFETRVSPDYKYHDLQHTRLVVEAVQDIAQGYDLTEEELLALQLAAWFHDTGYDQGAEEHEARGARYARAFLAGKGCEEHFMVMVEDYIMATRFPQSPNGLLEQIICDADLSHLGTENYWDRCGRVREELNLTRGELMSDPEWTEFELSFMAKHEYHTEEGRRLYNKRKEKHIRQLVKRKMTLSPTLDDDEMGRAKKKKKKKREGLFGSVETSDQALKQLNLGRGVETMYRTTYRTHINLSSIADNKANIMLSINAIIISIVTANLVPQFADTPLLIGPTVLLLAVCLTALVFAVLATRPKVTEGKVTRGDIADKRANLLFFGNFHSMKLEDFHWGMMEMIKDSDFLYSSMTRDLYYLGVVMAKKYRYLSICYSVFMYGLILSVAVFALVFTVFG